MACPAAYRNPRCTAAWQSCLTERSAGPAPRPAGSLPSVQILLTGATGSLGQRVLLRLTERGHHVRCLVRRPVALPAGAEPVTIDLAGPLDDPAALVAGTQVLVSLAAAIRDVDAATSRAVNVDAPLALARALRDAGGSHVVHASTNLVYGPQPLVPVGEDAVPAPWGTYALDKRAAEVALLDLARPASHRGRRDGFGAVILRLAALWGSTPGQLAAFAQRRLVDTRPDALAHLLTVDDAARAIVDAVERDPVSGVLNLGDDEPMAIRELAALLDLPLVAPGDQQLRLPEPALAMDTALAKDRLGWYPRVPSVREGLEAGLDP